MFRNSPLAVISVCVVLSVMVIFAFGCHRDDNNALAQQTSIAAPTPAANGEENTTTGSASVASDAKPVEKTKDNDRYPYVDLAAPLRVAHQTEKKIR